MTTLYIEPDAEKVTLWLPRLSQVDECVVVATSAKEIQDALDSTRFTLAVCGAAGLGLFSNDMSLRVLKRSVCWLICVAEASDNHAQELALKLGFDDWVAYSCSATLWSIKHANATQWEQLQQRLAQAQKLESIGELAAGIAHEINTPIQYVGDNTRFVQDACNDLSAVIEHCQLLIKAVDEGNEAGAGYATELLRKSLDDADVEYLVEEIPSAIKQTLDGVERVASIVRAMKEFSHPGASEMCLADIAKAITNTAMVARNEWKYVADLETDFDPNLPPVPCLAGELNQVFLNLLVNAAHAIGDSLGECPESKGKINVSTKRVDQFAEIRITDSGTGIPKEIINRIFTPFFTTKAAGKGTGQGLAIAHSVVTEKHSGTIQVESELGRGTTFVIRLPLEVAAEQMLFEEDEIVAVG